MEQLPSESFPFAKMGVRKLEGGGAKENLVDALWLIMHMSERHLLLQPTSHWPEQSHGHCNLKGWSRGCIVPPYPWEENLVDRVKDCHSGH